MNLIALELYRLRIEISTGFKWGWQRPLVGRYLWILGLTFLKAGWVSPSKTTPPTFIVPSNGLRDGTVPFGKYSVPRTRSGRQIIS